MQKDTLEIGAKRMAAVRAAMSSQDKKMFYCGLMLLSFAASLEVNLNNTLLQVALGELSGSSLSSVLSVTVGVLSIGAIPIYSQSADYFGRPGLVMVALTIYLAGIGIQISAQSFEWFAVGWVVSNLGLLGYNIQKAILMADLTSLKTRAILVSCETIPSTLNQWVSAFVAKPIADSLGWRVGFAIPTVVLAPAALNLVIFLYRIQAKGYHQYPQLLSHSEGTIIWTRVKQLSKSVDGVGQGLLLVGLLSVMLGLVLLGSSEKEWAAWYIPVLIFAGVVLLAGFFVWERRASEWTVPRRFFQGTTLGAMAFILALRVDSGLNWQYLTLNLMISRRIDVTHVALLEKGFQLASLASCLASGFIMKRVNDYRPLLVVGAAINCIGIGLMIPARLPTSSNAFVVFSQAVTGVGAGMIDVSLLIAYQGSVPRKDIAAITAAAQIVSSIGSSIGSTIAGVVWTQLVPSLLSKYVPGEIDIKQAISNYKYVWGLPEDQFGPAAKAFGDAQMYITSLSCFMAGVAFFISIVYMSSVDLSNTQKFDASIEDANHLD
ncbi:hypothetical protein DSO57_1018018 [Entomophthora muscae]|uniref:Uncharacterized protein n=1 Tax=Entomophthora muscae TaxID=34485 RepID=A0ACC2TFA6_9FUNG|nr:hypothetical protein DSO57_1018018 [Entomophthora muscae]